MNDRNPCECNETHVTPHPTASPAVTPVAGLPDIVEALCAHCREAGKAGLTHRSVRPFPSRQVVIELVEELRAVLFPGYFGTSDITVENMPFHVGSGLDHLLRRFVEQVRRGICFTCAEPEGQVDVDCLRCERQAVAIVQAFMNRLPVVQKRLASDVQAAFDGDPAAVTPDEALFCYPGILAVTNYRIAHELYRLDVPVIPRMITEHAHSITGIDIHPGATIGEAFFIDHGTGVVIGETAIIGNRVKLYQGVTMGARSFPRDENGRPVKGIARHPIVEDEVTVYANATLLGRITIGRGATIGGNVWLTHDVPRYGKISQGQLKEDLYTDGAGI